MASHASLPRVEVRILDERLRTNHDLRPTRATAGSAALDLRACLAHAEDLMPGGTLAIRTGIAIHINDSNYCGLIIPRSGLGSKHGIVLANTVGLIDSDYTGEITLCTFNRSQQPYRIEPYMRLCQLILQAVIHPVLDYVEEFSATSARGTTGFGSTGTS